MTWYKMCGIHREISREKININILERIFYWPIPSKYKVNVRYQHGIHLINEKGDTKDIWEKLDEVKQ